MLSGMTEPIPERTCEQASAAEALLSAGASTKLAATAFMLEMSGLRYAVARAHKAGISRTEAYGIVMDACNGNVPADVIASLRKTLRRTYNS
jgi:hypothetical protein